MMENERIIGTLNPPSESIDAYNVDEWFLVGSPLQMFLLLASYLAFVLKIGPYLMKDRAPFKLANIIIVYNILQVILSAYIFKVALFLLLNTGLSLTTCVSDSVALQNQFNYGLYVYMLAKISELLDTVFFVLRKKDRQVSLLHVYHHCCVFFYTWALLSARKAIVTMAVCGALNGFVHLVMYSYYALSVFPNISKYLWWKKYITSMQMIQFVLILIYAFYEYATTPCDFSGTLLVHVVANLSFVFYLFADFYSNTYTTPQASKHV